MPVSSGWEAGIFLVFFRFFLRGMMESLLLTRGLPPAPSSGGAPGRMTAPRRKGTVSATRPRLQAVASPYSTP